MRSLALLTLFTVVGMAILLSLGTWQVHRLAWKEALIARVDARVHAAPEPLPAPADWPGLQPEAIEYRPVTLTGTFDHAREIHVFIALGEPKGRYGGQGRFVLTPLTLADGHVVFVNRGFVPADRIDPATRADGQVTGPVTVTGLMRPSEPRSWLAPADDPRRNIWFVRDPKVMAAAVGLDPATVAPFTVDERAGESPGGLPQGGETIVAFPNSHLGYAITWYGLAAALAAVYAATLLGRYRRRPPG